jgi:hypothetical protein
MARLEEITNHIAVIRASVMAEVGAVCRIVPNPSVVDPRSVLTADERAELVHALQGLCRAVRECGFDQGVQNILACDCQDLSDNRRMAIQVYRLAWEDRWAECRQILDTISLFPQRADAFDAHGPSQSGVWEALRGYLDCMKSRVPAAEAVAALCLRRESKLRAKHEGDGCSALEAVSETGISSTHSVEQAKNALDLPNGRVELIDAPSDSSASNGKRAKMCLRKPAVVIPLTNIDVHCQEIFGPH